jgi:hypothetical protein
MGKGKVTDLSKAYPELAPDCDYPPLRFTSLKGRVSAPEWEARVRLLEWPAMRRFADRLDPSYKN